MAKLEGKIKDLEAELASTQSRTGEASKAFQRAERKAKELAFAQGEDRRTKIACLSWLPNSKARSRPTNSRLKKLKRLLLSILPSSERLSKNSKKPRSVQSLLWSCKWQPESSRLKDVP